MKGDNIEDVYELTPLQQGMLFHTLAASGRELYFEQFSAPIRGGLNVKIYRRAWQRVIDSHAVLRSAFFWEDVSKPLQVVFREVALPFDFHDWQALPAQEQAWRIDEYLQQDRARGFALEQAPLLRLGVMRLAPDVHQLVLSFHHILLDGWSKGLITREVSTCYKAFCQGQEPDLAPVRPYSEYIAWLQRQDPLKAETFWRSRVGDFASPNKLLIERPAPPFAVGPSTMDVRDLYLAAPLMSSLRTLARQCQVTMNTLMLGAWAIVLARYSDSEDVVFGTVVSGRPVSLPGVESMVGLFINTLPLRVAVRPGATLPDYLAGLQQQQAEQREFEHTSLADVQGWTRVPRQIPLFDTLVVYENYPLADSGTESASIDPLVRSHERTNYPLTLLIIPGARLALRALYEEASFDGVAIERLMTHIQTLLEGMVADPQARLSRLPLLTAAERELLLHTWNATEAAFPQACLHELFAAQVQRTPQAIAAVCGEQTLTYEALDGRANQLAQRLRREGVGPDTLVGLCVERSLDMLVGLLGILKAGGAYVPLDPAYPAERLAFMLCDAEVAVLLTQRALLVQLPQSEALILCLDDEALLADEPVTAPEVELTPAHLAYVIYTSGSTGTPKGVAMRHAPLANLIGWQLREPTFRARARTLQLAPLGFDVSFQEVFSTWCSGGTLVLAPERVRRDADALAELVEEQAIERLFVPFVALEQLAEALISSSRGLPSLREVITAGEQLKITPAVEAWFEGAPDCSLTNQYGPTETHVVTAHTLHGPPRDWPRLPPIGRPIANARVYLLDSRLEPVPQGVPGELYIGGACLARGYLRRDSLTAKRFIPSPFGVPGERLYGTGDVAFHHADGSIQFIGRCDDQVKVRGFRIELGEVEAVLAQHPSVRQAAVAADANAPGGTRIVAFIVPAGVDPPTSAELISYLRGRLPEYMVPAAYVALHELPRTPSGKVDRRSLALPRHAANPEREVQAPRAGLESLLCDLWGEVLDVKEVGITDNFFELGGHSLLATRLVSRIRSELRIPLAIRCLFETPTVAALAETIEALLIDEIEQLPGGDVRHVPVDPEGQWHEQ